MRRTCRNYSYFFYLAVKSQLKCGTGSTSHYDVDETAHVACKLANGARLVIAWRLVYVTCGPSDGFSDLASRNSSDHTHLIPIGCRCAGGVRCPEMSEYNAYCRLKLHDIGIPRWIIFIDIFIWIRHWVHKKYLGLTIAFRPLTLTSDFWPWPLTLIFSPRKAMTMWPVHLQKVMVKVAWFRS